MLGSWLSFLQSCQVRREVHGVTLTLSMDSEPEGFLLSHCLHRKGIRRACWSVSWHRFVGGVDFGVLSWNPPPKPAVRYGLSAG